MCFVFIAATLFASFTHGRTTAGFVVEGAFGGAFFSLLITFGSTGTIRSSKKRPPVSRRLLLTYSRQQHQPAGVPHFPRPLREVGLASIPANDCYGLTRSSSNRPLSSLTLFLSEVTTDPMVGSGVGERLRFEIPTTP